MIDTDTKHKDEILERPAKKTAARPPDRWRNWWRALTAGTTRDTVSGRTHWLEAGEIHHGDVAHPTKEIAEQRAAENCAENVRFGDDALEYLGAYPEGTRP